MARWYIARPDATPTVCEHAVPVAQGAQCARHDTVQAVEVCARCGCFVCAECLQFRETDVLCPGCYERYMGKPSSRAIWSLVLSVAGVSCGCLLPGVAGLVLALQELEAIERGESPESGKAIAQGGKYIGLFNVALLVLVGLGVVVAVIAGSRF